MEFKASWLTVENPKDEKWKKYKLTKAKICSADKSCQIKTFALVGLHIIHKTTSQASWVWATFEHMDNAPDLADVNANKVADRDYTFYNKHYKSQKVHENCVDGKKNVFTTSLPNIQPLYALTLKNGKPVGDCKPYPIQVARQFPLPSTIENPIVQTNNAAHQLIKNNNSDSVYQYYNLVNVLWNDSPVDENKAKTLPIDSLSQTGFRPTQSAFPVANTTMETYIQDKNCVFCHSEAEVKVPKDKNSFASDYSFIFSLAGPKNNK